MEHGTQRREGVVREMIGSGQARQGLAREGKDNGEEGDISASHFEMNLKITCKHSDGEKDKDDSEVWAWVSGWTVL